MSLIFTVNLKPVDLSRSVHYSREPGSSYLREKYCSPQTLSKNIKMLYCCPINPCLIWECFIFQQWFSNSNIRQVFTNKGPCCLVSYDNPYDTDIVLHESQNRDHEINLTSTWKEYSGSVYYVSKINKLYMGGTLDHCNSYTVGLCFLLWPNFIFKGSEIVAYPQRTLGAIVL